MVVLTAVSCSRVRLSLTSTTRWVQSSPHKAEPLCRVQNLSRSLSVQSLLGLNWIRAGAVAGRGSDCGAVRCQGAVRGVGGVMVSVEHVFSQVLVVEGGVPGEMIGQRWSRRLDRRQTLALSLRPETRIKQILRLYLI